VPDLIILCTGQLVSRLLNYGNRSEVRELGLNLLLRLLDILEGQADSLLLDMLGMCVCLCV